MNKTNQIKYCRICGSTKLSTIADYGEQKLTGRFPKDSDTVVPEGPLKLIKCLGECGLVQLGCTYDLGDMYGDEYGYRSGLNKSMVMHLNSKVKRIEKIVKQESGDIIIDIGSNDGTTLGFFNESFTKIGVDPTAKKFSRYYKDNIKIIPEFFPSKKLKDFLYGRKAKIITSFSMFYDLEDPMEFTLQIKEHLSDEGIWVFEQSYLPLMLATNSFDTACHEHLEYYSLKQIKYLLEKADMKIIDIELNKINGGSISITAARKSSSYTESSTAFENLRIYEEIQDIDSVRVWVEFEKRIEIIKRDLFDLFDNIRLEGKKIGGLGASTKGNVLLQYFGINSEILPYIGEVNSDKFGSYTPGTSIPIISEHEVVEKFDYLLVLPWHFKEFFISNSKLKGKKLIFPLPYVHVIEL